MTEEKYYFENSDEIKEEKTDLQYFIVKYCKSTIKETKDRCLKTIKYLLFNNDELILFNDERRLLGKKITIPIIKKSKFEIEKNIKELIRKYRKKQ